MQIHNYIQTTGNQSGQKRSLLARQRSCPEEPNSDKFLNNVTQRFPPSTSLLKWRPVRMELQFQNKSLSK